MRCSSSRWRRRRASYLYAIGAEEPPGGGFQARPHAASDFLRSVHRRFRWIVADVPRGDPVIQRQVMEASTDIVLVTDLSLPGVRDAMRLQQLAHDVAPNARLHLATGGVLDPRRSAVKVADLERTMKRKVDCQLPADMPSALAAVNFGKPLPEAAPNSPIVKALRPLVAVLDEPGDEVGQAAKGASARLRALHQRPAAQEEVSSGIRPAQQEPRKRAAGAGRSARSPRPPRRRGGSGRRRAG